MEIVSWTSDLSMVVSHRVFDLRNGQCIKGNKRNLKERFYCESFRVNKKQVSHDGTTKFLFKTSDGALLESVMMVFDYGRSVCVSSQVGCNMGCAFCASGLNKEKKRSNKR